MKIRVRFLLFMMALVLQGCDVHSRENQRKTDPDRATTDGVTRLFMAAQEGETLLV